MSSSSLIPAVQLPDDAPMIPVEARSGWFDILELACFQNSKREDMQLGANAVLPMVWTQDPKALKLSVLANYFTDHFYALNDDENITQQDVADWARALCQRRYAPKEIHFEGLHEGRLLGNLYQGLLQAGYYCELYPHNGNWFFEVTGEHKRYWENRPSRLKNTISRKLKKVTKENHAEFVFLTDPAQVEEAIECYQEVSKWSWQPEEEFEAFLPALVKWAFRSGSGLVSILRLDSQLLSVQIWLIGAGRATLFKLAYRKDAKNLSPGTLLTYKTIEQLYQRADICSIDFGRGDDNYKKDWADLRHQCWGLNAYSKHHLSSHFKGAKNHLSKLMRVK